MALAPRRFEPVSEPAAPRPPRSRRTTRMPGWVIGILQFLAGLMVFVALMAAARAWVLAPEGGNDRPGPVLGVSTVADPTTRLKAAADGIWWDGREANPPTWGVRLKPNISADLARWEGDKQTRVGLVSKKIGGDLVATPLAKLKSGVYELTINSFDPQPGPGQPAAGPEIRQLRFEVK